LQPAKKGENPFVLRSKGFSGSQAIEALYSWMGNFYVYHGFRYDQLSILC
jgi:hypothetical protein